MMGHCCARNVPVDGDGGAGGGGAVTTTNSVCTARGAGGGSGGGWGRHQRGRRSRGIRASVGGEPPLPEGIASLPASSATMLRRFFWRPFPPPSPAKHIKASLVCRLGQRSPAAAQAQATKPPLEVPIPAKYELGKEVGRGHFDHTCLARDMRGHILAVKVIVKAKDRV